MTTKAGWDTRYRAGEFSWDAEPLLVEIADELAPGRALDLACGPGRNAIYLAQLGWSVAAVDASPVAIELLRGRAAERGVTVDARVADLERGEFAIEPDAYDLMCDFYYLQRSLVPQIRAGVRAGGVFAAAIHLEGSFAVQPGELRGWFEDWKILYYSENRLETGRRRRKTTQLVARRA